MTLRTRAHATAVLALVAAGCAEQEFQPPDREAQVEAADAVYDTLGFDEPPPDSLRALEGDVVFASRCRSCHGPTGEGGTDYARERDLDVPSLVRPDWPYGESVDSVRRRIFTGHPRGMPTWGVAGLEPREIDAVAYWLVNRLRPEMRGSGEG